MSEDWITKYGPRRVRRDPPTLDEAIFAAIGITDDQRQQAEKSDKHPLRHPRKRCHDQPEIGMCPRSRIILSVVIETDDVVTERIERVERSRQSHRPVIGPAVLYVA